MTLEELVDLTIVLREELVMDLTITMKTSGDTTVGVKGKSSEMGQQPYVDRANSSGQYHHFKILCQTCFGITSMR